jgi:hypothetical protein
MAEMANVTHACTPQVTLVTPAMVNASADEWDKGYDRAAREVLEEVKAADMGLYLRLLTKFPGWRKIMRERAGGSW